MIKDADLRSSNLQEILEVLLAADGEVLTVPQIQRRLSQDRNIDMTRKEVEAHLRWSQVQSNAAGEYFHVHAVSAQRLTQRPGTWTTAPK